MWEAPFKNLLYDLFMAETAVDACTVHGGHFYSTDDEY